MHEILWSQFTNKDTETHRRLGTGSIIHPWEFQARSDTKAFIIIQIDLKFFGDSTGARSLGGGAEHTHTQSLLAQAVPDRRHQNGMTEGRGDAEMQPLATTARERDLMWTRGQIPGSASGT